LPAYIVKPPEKKLPIGPLATTAVDTGTAAVPWPWETVTLVAVIDVANEPVPTTSAVAPTFGGGPDIMVEPVT